MVALGDTSQKGIALGTLHAASAGDDGARDDVDGDDPTVERRVHMYVYGVPCATSVAAALGTTTAIVSDYGRSET